MGSWTLLNITGTTAPFIRDNVGHDVKVTYRLKYAPTPFDSFRELPMLHWNEKIFMIEHHAGQWWEFETNMYQLKPQSKTLEVWPQRYIVAYDTANNVPRSPLDKGSARLLSTRGAPITARDLGTARDDAAKADAVRHYLKKHGGMLEILIHDVPAIIKPDRATHKERLLVFDCGFAGGGARFRGTQYLDVDGAVGQGSWVQDFQVNAGPLLAQKFLGSTAGKTKVAAPPSVSAPIAPIWAPGEVM